MNNEESPLVFFKEFRQKRLEIEANIETATNVDVVVALVQECIELQKHLNDSARFLPAYDVRQSQEHIKALRVKIDSKKSQLAPKKKFAFKGSKTKTKPKSESAVVPVASVEEYVSSKKAGFADMQDKTIELNQEEANDKDIELLNLSKCEVTIRGHPGSLHVKNLKDCTVNIGPISRSILLFDCENCTFQIASQQIRIHSSRECTFYIHVTSGAIIEDCKELQFGAYTWVYDGLDDDYVHSNLDRNNNKWDKVEDFYWQNPTLPSPNWKKIE
eukprot:m.342146 g.342146  ORF g.342146 m.342146 type:complete len:273 (-) comp21024_c0_seq1:171-989(-)